MFGPVLLLLLSASRISSGIKWTTRFQIKTGVADLNGFTPGSKISASSAASDLVCGGLCSRKPDCRAATFTVAHGTNCYLSRNSTPNLQPDPGARTMVPSRELTCDPNQYTIGGRCMLFETGPVTWYGARGACGGMGAKLAVVDSNLTFHAIRKILKETVGQGSAWVDGSDETIEGNWVIWDGSSLPWTGWASDEPTGNSNQNCMGFGEAQDLFLNDRPCTRDRSYICEL